MYGANYVVYHPDTHTAVPLSESYIIYEDAFPENYKDESPHQIESELFTEDCLAVCSESDIAIVTAAIKGFIDITTHVIHQERELDDEDTSNIELLLNCWNIVRRSAIVINDDIEATIAD